MLIHNASGFDCLPLPGRLGWPKHSLTLVVKGSYRLQPAGTAELAEKQPPLGPDVYFPDDPEERGGPYYESDLAYHKPRADLLLVGRCHAPGGRSVRRSEVSFAVGATRRELVVFGDRSWKHGLVRSTIGEPASFRTMDLRYENAFGGPGFAANPIGKGFRAKKEKSPLAVLPNIEDPAALIRKPDDRPTPAGFGPRSRTWAPRTGGIGTFDAEWFRTRRPWFPEDHAWDSENAAPEGLRSETFPAGDETIELQNLHREHASYRSALPGHEVVCAVVVVGPGGRQLRPVPLQIDTVWIDAESEQLVLVWRGHTETVSDECEDIERVLVARRRLGEAQEQMQQWQATALSTVDETPEEEPIEYTPPEPDPPPPPTPEEQAVQREQLKIDRMLDKLGVQTEFPPDPPALPPASPGAVARILERLNRANPLPETDEPGLADLMASLRSVPAPDGAGKADAAAAAEAKPPKPDLTAFPRNDKGGPVLDALDLTGADLGGADLQSASLRKTRLGGADLTRANLAGADLEEADLERADLTGARLDGARAPSASFDGARLNDASIVGADLSGARLEQASLEGANLSRARLDEATLSGADLTGALLEEVSACGAVLVGVTVTRARWTSANLEGATLERSSGSGADFSSASLAGAQFHDAVLEQAIFVDAAATESIWTRANLPGADFSGATLVDADLTKARLEGANLSQADLAGANLRKTRLEEARIVESNLFEANLRYADLRGSDLSRSNCYGADFGDTETRGMKLREANVGLTQLDPDLEFP